MKSHYDWDAKRDGWHKPPAEAMKMLKAMKRASWWERVKRWLVGL